MSAPAWASTNNGHPDRVLAFAHRGGAKLWPENTLLAFEKAYALGCRYLETDVRASRDGQLVAFHDATLERTTNGHGPVAERTLEQLLGLDAGYGFQDAAGKHSFRGQGITIPTLRELLESLPQAHFNIEIKPRDLQVAQALWDLIEQLGVHGRVLVAAAQTVLVRHFRQISRGRVPTSAGRREVASFWAKSRLGRRSESPPYQALQVPPAYGPLRVVTRHFVESAHRAGVQVHVWTVDCEETMRQLVALGVDGLMSDRPDRLISVVGATS